ncbi:MAG: 5'/3'-nucleotidase SurE [Bacteroidia bacterium]|nr:5'/3'-nucleotidase SurE [Bacteroidia bacterium]
MTEKKPLILVTNDDGITAPGIGVLVKAMRELGDVVVIAPDKPQSGMGHAITINHTIRLRKEKYHGLEKEYSSTGTPVDCVKLAINKILPRKPDLVVSGINHGSNLSISVIYSGTLSAAMEGAIEGIPSVGFSLCDHSIDADFSACSPIVTKIAGNVLRYGLPAGCCLNVNIPAIGAEDIRGIRFCRQTHGYWIEELDERKDPSGVPYFWLTGSFLNLEKGKEDTDVWACDNGYVAVVPVHFDMTMHKAFQHLNNWEL